MRVNSYNKFFAEVAKIMNTDVKDVKQLDGRYKVELSNHVYLNVYRGISGTLFIHDHRGIAHITSCYDFEDFKTMKDLYERLITDYGETTATEKNYDDYTVEDFIDVGIAKECTDCPDFCEEDCIENAECAKGNDVFEGCKKSIDTIIAADNDAYKNSNVIDTDNVQPNLNTCCIISPYIHCDYNYKSDACIKAANKFIYDCEKIHKQMKAIRNPKWHHVSLATLANIDFDMLDEKRQLYFKLYRELQETCKNLQKCKSVATFDRCSANIRAKSLKMFCNDEITALFYQFILLKLSMLNVECGMYDSAMELATNMHESRRYNKNYCN